MLHQEDARVKCPYDDSHIVYARRMQTHLVKCRKNYDTSDYVHCPLNATHQFPKQELEYHLQTCSNRSLVDDALYTRTNEEPVVPVLTPDRVRSLVPDTEETWDDDSGPSYDPMENTANRNVVRILKGAPPAARKAFQQQERRRLLDLQQKEEREGPIRVLSTGRANISVTADGSRAVRMPMQHSKAVMCAAEQSEQLQQGSSKKQ